MAFKSNIRVHTTQIHIHKLVQSNKDMTYDSAYKKYGHLIDEDTRMIRVEDLKLFN